MQQCPGCAENLAQPARTASHAWLPRQPQARDLIMPCICPDAAGSGRSFTAYIFNRVDPPVALPAPVAAEQSVAEGVATPDRSQELPDFICASQDSSTTNAATSAAAAAAAIASVASGAALVDQGLPDKAVEPAVASAAAPVVASLPAGEPGEGRDGEAAQQPALGRGARRAARDRRAVEAGAELAAAGASKASVHSMARRSTCTATAGPSPEPQATAAPMVGRAGKRGSPLKVASPQKPKGVQKKLSPKKQAPVLLQGAPAACRLSGDLGLLLRNFRAACAPFLPAGWLVSVIYHLSPCSLSS
jgi:hypothetical protein